MKDTNHVDTEKQAELIRLHKKLDTHLQNVKNDIDIIKINQTLDEIEKINPIPEDRKISKDYFINRFREELLDEGLRRRAKDLEECGEEKKALPKDKKYRFSFRFAKVALVATLAMGMFTPAIIGNYQPLKTYLSWTPDVVTISTRQPLEPVDITEQGAIAFASFEEVKEAYGISFYSPIEVDEVIEITVIDNFTAISIRGKFIFRGNYLLMNIMCEKSTNGEVTMWAEKCENEGFIIYPKDNVDFLIIPNNQWYTIMLHDGFNSYSISQFDSANDAKEFIDNLTY